LGEVRGGKVEHVRSTSKNASWKGGSGSKKIGGPFQSKALSVDTAVPRELNATEKTRKTPRMAQTSRHTTPPEEQPNSRKNTKEEFKKREVMPITSSTKNKRKVAMEEGKERKLTGFPSFGEETSSLPRKSGRLLRVTNKT